MRPLTIWYELFPLKCIRSAYNNAKCNSIESTIEKSARRVNESTLFIARENSPNTWPVAENNSSYFPRAGRKNKVLRASKSNALSHWFRKIFSVSIYWSLHVIRLMIMTQIQYEIAFLWVEMIKMKTRSSSVRIKCSKMTNDCFIGFSALHRRFAIKAALYERHGFITSIFFYSTKSD